MNSIFTLPASAHGITAPDKGHHSSSQSYPIDPVVKFKWQPHHCSYLASVGVNNIIQICDRQGVNVDYLPLPSTCASLGWSPDGETLVAVVETSPTIFIWDGLQRRSIAPIDTSMKGLSKLAWTFSGDVLAVGTLKGNLLLYNRRTMKKTPVMGKHSKAITCAIWSKDDILACASLDNTFTLTNLSGDTIYQMGVKGEPSDLQWSFMKTPQDSITAVLSIVLSSKTLFFHTMENPDSPIELAFQSKYGSIVTYKWFNDAYVMIGFSTGYFVVVSTNLNEIGQEKFQARNHKDSLSNIAISATLSKAATCGDGIVKVHELNDLKDVYAILDLEDERGALEGLEWSDDGGFLTVGSRNGALYSFLSRLPIFGSSYENITVHLTAMCEVTITDHNREGRDQLYPIYKKDLSMEPTVIGVGPQHWTVATNEHVQYYFGGFPRRPLPWGKPRPPEAYGKPSEMVMQRDYPSSVKSIQMSDKHTAVLMMDGRVQVHPLDNEIVRNSSAFLASQHMFPEKEVQSRTADDTTYGITCVSISNDLMVYGASTGIIHHYSIEDWSLVNEHRHKRGIIAIYLQPHATKYIFRDESNDAFLCEPARDVVLNIANISAKTCGILWESCSDSTRSVFVSWDDNFITTHVFQPFTIKGPQVLTLGTTKLPYGFKPIVFIGRSVSCQTPSGKLSNVQLSTHEPFSSKTLSSMTEQAQGKALQLAYTVGMHKDVWDSISVVTSRKAWTMFAESCLYVLDLPVARRVYRQILHDGGMVLTLTTIMDETEDLLAISGHVCSIFRDFDHAQDFFLASSHPELALELRRDLMHWDQALTLADRLAPEELTVICREYAAKLERDKKFDEALTMYERALETSNVFAGSAAQLDDHQVLCSAGITRMTFRIADVARGMRMLNSVGDAKLLTECALILEGIKMWAECGSLYERAGSWEKAAEVYIKAKLWEKVGKLLDKVTSPKIFQQYGKAKEASHQYQEAVVAYERGQDLDSVVRLCVEQLQDIDKAVRVVRETRSRDAARIVSRFFQERKDFKSVVEFCLMAGMDDEAFDLAQQNDVMEHFAELVKNTAKPAMLTNIAAFFESRNMLLLAGKYYTKVREYARALNLFMKCPVIDGESVELAIEVVGLAKNDALTHELIDYLMGETDGVPKEAKYIFKLYMSLGSYRDAARTAIIIAREEQTLGNYRAAHDLLLDNHRQLTKNNAAVPTELTRMLMILHSYVLVKTLIRANNHLHAARLLIRVSSNISKFPSHVVPILTSTVLECQRAGLVREAFEHAAMLMRPEYRNAVDAKYKKKIELIVRKRENGADGEGAGKEGVSECPFCAGSVAEWTLDCLECRNLIPFCIASGMHMTRSEWSRCPHCLFPALITHFKELVKQTHACPMCNHDLAVEDIKLEKDVSLLLKGASDSITGDNSGTATSKKDEPHDEWDTGLGVAALEGGSVLPVLSMNASKAMEMPGGVFGNAVIGSVSETGGLIVDKRAAVAATPGLYKGF